MKKLRALVAMLLGSLLVVPTAAMADEMPTFTPPPIYEHGHPITLHVDGVYIPCDVDPIIRHGRTLMPMRAAGEALGATVRWDGNTQTVTVIKADKTIRFYIGKQTYTVNGVNKTTDVPPTVIQNRTMLPLRVFAEALGTRVDWDQYLLDVSISTSGEKIPLTAPPIDTTNDVYKFVQKYYTPSNEDDGLLGSWVYRDMEYGVPTEIYEFFYRTENGIQNIEIIAQQRPYYDFPTIKVYKSDTTARNDAYWRYNYQHILYLKESGHGYTGHSDSEFRMLNGHLTETGIIWYEMETDAFQRYEPIDPLIYQRF